MIIGQDGWEALDAVEFLHRACRHIPDLNETVIRYYGHYTNASRGKRKKNGLEELVTSVVVEEPRTGSSGTNCESVNLF